MALIICRYIDCGWAAFVELTRMDARELRMRLGGDTPHVTVRASPASEGRLKEITREESQRFLARFGINERAEENLRRILSSFTRIEISREQRDLTKASEAGVITRRDTDNPERLAERLQRVPVIPRGGSTPPQGSSRLASVISQLLERTVAPTAQQLVDAHLKFDAQVVERLKQAIQQVGREYPVETLLRVVLLIEQRIERGGEVDDRLKELARELRRVLEGFVQTPIDEGTLERYLTEFQDTLFDSFPMSTVRTLTERNQRLLAVLERQLAITIESIEREPLTPGALRSIRERLVPVMEPFRASAVQAELPRELRQSLQTVSNLLLKDVNQDVVVRELPEALRELAAVIRSIGRIPPPESVARGYSAERGSLQSFEQSLMQSIREALHTVVRLDSRLRNSSHDQALLLAPAATGTVLADRAAGAPSGENLQSQLHDSSAQARTSADRSRAEEVARRAPEQLRRLTDLVERIRMPEGSDQSTAQMTRFIEQTVAAQQQLAQIAPMLKAAGEPTLLLFPGLFQGLLSRIEIVDYQHCALNRSSGDGGGSETLEERESFTVRVELPNLGEILAIVSYTPRELIVTLQSPHEHVRQFLKRSVGKLRLLGQRLGFGEVSVMVEPSRGRPRLPLWVAHLGTPRVL